MKKASLFLCSALAMAAGAAARPVSENTAREAAAGFLNHTDLAGAPLQLVYHPLYQRNLQHSTFYAFNAGSKGFVIIAGDDALHPVLAYSSESSFRPAAIPASVADWLGRYEKTAAWALDRLLSADEATQGEWDALLAGTGAKTTGSSAVLPMVETHWGQDGYYNTNCPWDNTALVNAYTGCTATSMAQIMRFWKHPLTGTGSHSYIPTNNPQYGTQTADFGAATYNWSQMPAVVNSANPEVAKLMYHAGVSVEMHYSAQGSGAQVINFGGQINVSSENALPDYFGYKRSLEGTMRDFLDPGREWMPMLKMELNGGRPFIYVGYGPGGGHAYVADGYDVQDRLHINWGWDGFYDGYFMVDAMEPGPPGLGNSYNDDQQALIGIEPEHSALNLDLHATLNAPLFIAYLQPFTVKTKVINSGTAAFSGDYALRIFDTLGNVVDSIQVMSNQSLGAGVASAELSFASSGNINMQPGTYWAGLYYRTQNGRWRQAGRGAGGYVNLRTIVVNSATNTGTTQVPSKSRMSLYPNPAADFVQLLSPVDAQVRLLDLQGRTLATDKAVAGAALRISTAALPEGIYQVELLTAAGTETKKLQVRR